MENGPKRHLCDTFIVSLSSAAYGLAEGVGVLHVIFVLLE